MQRKTPIKRSNKPIRRHTPLKRSNNYGRNNPKIGINSESEELIQNLYPMISRMYLETFSTCGINLPGCTHIATEVHHKQGRGPYLLAILTYISACRSCHTTVGIHSKAAIAAGHSISRNKIDGVYGLRFLNRKVVSFIIKIRSILNLKIIKSL